MTNEAIIFANAQALARDGIIKYTGREFVTKTDDGKEIVVKETEPIHTYSVWKQMGYQVQKGQKAVAQFVIWKHSEKVDDDGERQTKMFMKKASFFTRAQVEAIE
ncbi:MAG: hypothetical protein J6112_03505 [Clostridia bacterium]|nr:hypothetical protein [Clostridia bacterium]